MCALYCAFVSLLQGIFSFVLSVLSVLSIPIAPLVSLTIDNWFLANSGIPQAISILVTALTIRFVLNLIPFFRV
ncbi:hypothetical protein [Thermocrinis sp.]|jgi:hypothetical protein|uniref:hypothetical protein n=1 Tax=Thermocrinis sp. TaxID=2024383 RepID=UPI003C07BC82